jgi:hypothetical protein
MLLSYLSLLQMSSRILDMARKRVISLRADLPNDHPLPFLYWNVQMQVVYILTPWTDQQLSDFFVSNQNPSIWENLTGVLDQHATLILTRTESPNSIVPLLSIISKVIPLDRTLRMSLRRRLFLITNHNEEDESRGGTSPRKRESPHPLLLILEATDESTKHLLLNVLILLFRGNLRFMLRYVPFGYVSAISLQPETYAPLIRISSPPVSSSSEEADDDEDEMIVARAGSSTEISETDHHQQLLGSSTDSRMMAQEEKERETDRLIYLLNRLHQTGVVTVPSPEAIEELNRRQRYDEWKST